MKSQEKLNVLKTEVFGLQNKPSELSEDELDQVTGGAIKTKGEKKVKFKKSCPHCNQNSMDYVPGTDGWYCAACGKKVKIYKGLAKDKPSRI